MIEIYCPFCGELTASDVIDSFEEVDGQWECDNGHQFTVKYLRTIDYNEKRGAGQQ